MTAVTAEESQPPITGKAVVVGMKLDSPSRELLTWALVKASLPGDQVIAVHVIDASAAAETTSSLLALVNTLHSVLSVYEGFCNLKQVDLKLKVCRGKSVRKVLVREAESYGSATVVVGVSKTRHGIRSYVSVAKYCAAKLPRCISVFAVDNSRVRFKRESNTDGSVEADGQANFDLLFNKTSLSVSNDSGSNTFKCHHRIRKSCSKCRIINPEKDCVVCETGSIFSDDNSVAQSEDGNASVSHAEGHLSALVPIQTSQEASPQCLKPGWGVLRHLLKKKQWVEKPVEKSSVFLWIPTLPRLHSSVIYPDQKQSVSNEGHYCSTTLDGESGAIIPFGCDLASPFRSPDGGFESFPKELLSLNERYSDACRLFSFQELLLATSNFSPENIVGRGGSSYVYRGHFPDGKVLAVKILKPSEDVIKEFVQEINIITALNHKNIVSLFGFCVEEENLLLVYDFMSRGSLEENLHGHKEDRNDEFGWQERYHVAVGVAEALDYLHCGCKEPVIHRDVKSSNILLSDDFEPQLSDFGLASWASDSSQIICTDVAGTFGYLAPEYLMHGKVSDKVDVYAFGVVLLELLSGRKPINREFPKDQESLVMWAKPILKNGNISQLLDPILGSSETDQEKIERMVLAATLCIRHVPRLRPSITIVLKLLRGDEEVTKWERQQEPVWEDQEESDDGEPFPNDIQSHLNLALLDIEDDSLSSSSSDRSVSLDEYLRGHWSRSSSFD